MYSLDRVDLLNTIGRGSIDSKESYIRICCGQAYSDMQPRTISGLSKFKKKNPGAIESVVADLAMEIYDYMHSPLRNKNDFDKWHHNKCLFFINEFNNITNNKVKIEYGKAQKIINVAFKYIYSLDGADNKLDYFEYCHMVLDRYTYSEGFYKKEIAQRGGKLDSWSNLDYKTYIKIQDNIRNYLVSSQNTVYRDSNNNPLTAFEAEFYIFAEYNTYSKNILEPIIAKHP